MKKEKKVERVGRYKISFEVEFKEFEDGSIDTSERFIEGCLSDLGKTHGLECEDIKIKE